MTLWYLARNNTSTPELQLYLCLIILISIAISSSHGQSKGLMGPNKACTLSEERGHSLVRDGPLSYLGLNKYFFCFFTYLCLCSLFNSLFMTTKSLDPISICNNLVSQPGGLLWKCQSSNITPHHPKGWRWLFFSLSPFCFIFWCLGMPQLLEESLSLLCRHGLGN